MAKDEEVFTWRVFLFALIILVPTALVIGLRESEMIKWDKIKEDTKAYVKSPIGNKIDGSSEDRFKKSIREISSSLSDKKKQEFKKSLKVILVHEGVKNILRSWARMTEEKVVVIEKLDGMTAEEIIEKAEEVKKLENEKDNGVTVQPKMN
jgi:hypothetical protein